MTSTVKEHEPPKHEPPKHEDEAHKLAEVVKKRDEAARRYNEEGLKREEARLKEAVKEEREPKFEQAERSKLAEKLGPEQLAGGNIVASTTNADGATTTSAASAFLGGGDVVTCQCTNGAAPPNNPCQAILLLSVDAVNYVRVDSRWFGAAPSWTYFVRFNMADYAGNPDIFNQQLPWLWYKIQFKGNQGAAVTVAATNSGT